MARPRRKTFLVVFVVEEIVMVIFSRSALFPPFSMLENYLSFLLLCPLIAASGPGVFFGMAGCLVFVAFVIMTLWAASFHDLASAQLERCFGAYPVDFSGCWTPPEYWDADDIALEIPDHPNFWTDGNREDFSSVGGFEVAGAGVSSACFCACF